MGVSHGRAIYKNLARKGPALCWFMNRDHINILYHLVKIKLRMKRTVKLFFDLPEGEKKILFETFESCMNVFNDHIEWSFANKTWSKKKAHADLYHILREKYPNVPSALLQSSRDSALESVKALKFKFRPRKSSRSAIRYDARTLSLRGKMLKFSTNEGRIKTRVSFSDYHNELIEGMKRKGGSTIGYDRKKDRFFVTLTYECDDPDTKQEGETIGIDRGVKSLITTSRGESLGNELKRVRRKHHHLRRRLQAKGTRSTRRLLKTLSGKEQRFSREVNHIISKQLAEDAEVKTYVIENLTGIRKGAKKGKKRKKANRWINFWPFAQFEQFLTYKSIGNGIEVVRVSPKFTSQDCSECGFRDSRNRDGSDFRCLRCGHHENADVNAAKNIRNRHITSLLESGDAGHSQLPVRTEGRNDSLRPRHRPRAGVS